MAHEGKCRPITTWNKATVGSEKSGGYESEWHGGELCSGSEEVEKNSSKGYQWMIWPAKISEVGNSDVARTVMHPVSGDIPEFSVCIQRTNLVIIRLVTMSGHIMLGNDHNFHVLYNISVAYLPGAPSSSSIRYDTGAYLICTWPLAKHRRRSLLMTSSIGVVFNMRRLSSFRMYRS